MQFIGGLFGLWGFFYGFNLVFELFYGDGCGVIGSLLSEWCIWWHLFVFVGG